VNAAEIVERDIERDCGDVVLKLLAEAVRAAAVSLYVTHYNMCRVHEALRTTPAVALGIAGRVWSIGDLLDAALAVAPADPTTTAPEGGKS
jgi:hypothetical protein